MALSTSQNEFARSTMQPMVQGNDVTMPSQFEEAWNTVLEEHPSTVNLMNAEERTTLLAQEVDKDMKQKATALIEEQAETPEEAQHLKQRLTEGQLILAREVGSEEWDTLITPENLGEYKALEYEIYSPTLQTNTTDFVEVMNTQSMIHVTANLQQWVNIESVSLTEEGIEVVVIDRKTMKRGTIKVKIDPTQPSALLYDMGKESSGARYVAESSMPNWGNIVGQLIQPDQLGSVVMGMSLGNEMAKKDMIAQGLMAMTAGMYGANNMSQRHAEEEAILQDHLNNQMPSKPLLKPQDVKIKVPNVMGNKEDLRARAAARNKRIMDERKRMNERREQAGKEQDLIAKKKMEQAKMQQDAAKKANMDSRANYGGIGALLAGGTAALGTAGSSFLLLFS